MHIRSGFFQPQLEKIMGSLAVLKEDRPHGPKAVLSDHDTSATTGTIKHILGAIDRLTKWRSYIVVYGRAVGCPCCVGFPLHHSLSVSHTQPLYLERLTLSSPQIFELRELNDNIDLQRNCGRLLAMITSITPALDLIDPLMSALINILQESSVSLFAFHVWKLATNVSVHSLGERESRSCLF